MKCSFSLIWQHRLRVVLWLWLDKHMQYPIMTFCNTQNVLQYVFFLQEPLISILIWLEHVYTFNLLNWYATTTWHKVTERESKIVTKSDHISWHWSHFQCNLFAPLFLKRSETRYSLFLAMFGHFTANCPSLRVREKELSSHLFGRVCFFGITFGACLSSYLHPPSAPTVIWVTGQGTTAVLRLK